MTSPISAAARAMAAPLFHGVFGGRAASAECAPRPAPAAIPDFMTPWQRVRHWPTLFRRLHSIVKEEYSPAALDENLWALHQFHQGNPDPHYQMRTWRKAPAADVSPEQIRGLGKNQFVAALSIAMEIEASIDLFSRESGESLSLVLPNLAGYMGLTAAQNAYADANPSAKAMRKRPAWRREEGRHAQTHSHLIERFTGAKPPFDNPSEASMVSAERGEAFSHLRARMTTEWNASSGYALFAAHGEEGSGLERSLRNMQGDEVKHLAILSGARTYLFGDTPWQRFREMFQVGVDFYSYHKERRSSGAQLNDPLLAFEITVAHLMSEYYVQKWLRELPLETLRTVYETPSLLSVLPEIELAPDVRARRAAESEDVTRERERLAFWPEPLRRMALAQAEFERRHARDIDFLIANDLNAFHGAEISGSAADHGARDEISRVVKNLSGSDWSLAVDESDLEKALLARLRDYQIRNNRYVSGRTK